jgi:hypothetical protein
MQRLVALVGLILILGVTGMLAWVNRDRLARIYEREVEPRLRDPLPLPLPGAGGERGDAVGVPSPSALRAAERKEQRIARRGGPAYVVLSADEMASLIDARLDESARAVLDSVRVSLAEDRFRLEAQLLTDGFGEALGPLAGLLEPREPLRAAGTARVHRPGVVTWRPDELMLRTFPFPGLAIPRLVNRMTGGSDGAFHIAVPATVGDVRVRADGVTFYRLVN